MFAEWNEDFGVGNHGSIVEGWQILDDGEAIRAAVEKHGKDATTSVAYCGLEVAGNLEDAEYRFWFDLFLRLSKRDHVGWA
ncbi:hypothetical protein [Mesorhizobium sp. CO1-1-4]|uniref:hypothetical protein n=1 Tax=Mesorhizobium sp. CO1-1-4 TaxID=2876633 RepID=UPI001CCB676A|nr:hypothetical protein [Mesorhizobium sp. CO1-1-4]MBZ9740607.1 hypothetical protein [Mesorhizobium sp. CO1-1-4]